MRLISFQLLGLCLFEIGVWYKKLGIRCHLTVFHITFDWVGYDYVRDDIKNVYIQKMFRIHYCIYNLNYKSLQPSHVEWRFGKKKPCP